MKKKKFKLTELRLFPTKFCLHLKSIYDLQKMLLVKKGKLKDLIYKNWKKNHSLDYMREKLGIKNGGKI
jgi:hypothetical protein